MLQSWNKNRVEFFLLLFFFLYQIHHRRIRKFEFQGKFSCIFMVLEILVLFKGNLMCKCILKIKSIILLLSIISSYEQWNILLKRITDKYHVLFNAVFWMLVHLEQKKIYFKRTGIQIQYQLLKIFLFLKIFKINLYFQITILSEPKFYFHRLLATMKYMLRPPKNLFFCETGFECY